MESNPTRAEAERLLGISSKLLQKQDLNGSKEFAILAQETEPLLEGTDQILAVIDVLIASQKRITNTHDWYAVLQLDRRTDDLEVIKRQYRRLALLLHPDKNKFAFADSAFRLVADAWAVLSDGLRKSVFDSEVGLFEKVDLVPSTDLQNKLPVRRSTAATAAETAAVGGRRVGPGGENRSKNFPARRSTAAENFPARRSTAAAAADGDHGGENRSENFPARRTAAENFPVRRSTAETAAEVAAEVGGGGGGGENRSETFWTTCPYCYHIYEYDGVYEECCMRCQNCKRAFHAAAIQSLPPVVPGKAEYYCCWGFFPVGFGEANSGGGGGGGGGKQAFPVSSAPYSAPAVVGGQDGGGFVNFSQGNVVTPTPKKRGRPRKNVIA